ncbi:MAG: hypothetical protein HRT47_04510 [Candidatus Caenarcaniphilales bacterium]|nr:hypothetical protein [Candidatus Caenarcaniphilales bacterium]
MNSINHSGEINSLYSPPKQEPIPLEITSIYDAGKNETKFKVSTESLIGQVILESSAYSNFHIVINKDDVGLALPSSAMSTKVEGGAKITNFKLSGLDDPFADYMRISKNYLESNPLEKMKFDEILKEVEKITKQKNEIMPTILLLPPETMGDPNRNGLCTFQLERVTPDGLLDFNSFHVSTLVAVSIDFLKNNSIENNIATINHELNHMFSKVESNISSVFGDDFQFRILKRQIGFYSNKVAHITLSDKARMSYYLEAKNLLKLKKISDFYKAFQESQSKLMKLICLEKFGDVPEKKFLSMFTKALESGQFSGEKRKTVQFILDTEEDQRSKTMTNEQYTELSNLCDLYELGGEEFIDKYTKRSYPQYIQSLEANVLKPLYEKDNEKFHEFKEALQGSLKEGDLEQLRNFFLKYDPSFSPSKGYMECILTVNYDGENIYNAGIVDSIAKVIDSI